MNLIWRIVLGAALIAGFLGACIADARFGPPGWLLGPLATAIAILAADEALRLFRVRGGDAHRFSVLALVGLVVASNLAPVCWQWAGLAYPANCPLGRLGWPLAALAAATNIIFLVELRRYESPGKSIVNLGAAALALVYVGLLFSFLIQLRLLDRGPLGILPLASLIAVVKGCDIGAYAFGRLVGRHKMSPLISPGKTLEGAAGGLAVACAASYATVYWLGEGAPWDWRPAVYGLVIGAAGMFGDLAESLLKRDALTKDSSSWMPGFGGILDVTDSMMFAAPASYLLWVAGLMP